MVKKKNRVVSAYMDPDDESGTLYIFLSGVETPEEYKCLESRHSRQYEVDRRVEQLPHQERYGLSFRPTVWPKEIGDVVLDDVAEICREKHIKLSGDIIKTISRFFQEGFVRKHFGELRV